jgi:hypothetical protein
MALYSFEIGATSSTTNVESLTIPMSAPQSTFEPWSVVQKLADGTERTAGWPVATWHWGFMTRAQWNQLRAYITGKSGTVYIKTMKDDGTYVKYQAIMLLPAIPEQAADRMLDVTIQFKLISVV